MSLMLHMG